MAIFSGEVEQAIDFGWKSGTCFNVLLIDDFNLNDEKISWRHFGGTSGSSTSVSREYTNSGHLHNFNQGDSFTERRKADWKSQNVGIASSQLYARQPASQVCS